MFKKNFNTMSAYIRAGKTKLVNINFEMLWPKIGLSSKQL